MVVGLVGCGRWGRYILRDLLSLGCEVPVVARSDASRARAEEGGASAIVARIDELPALDGVVVATTTSTHAAVVEEVLERGAPVFCEKPLTNDAAAAARLAASAPDMLFVMDKWRYQAGVLELAAIARERRLGRVVGLTTVRVDWGHPHTDVDAVWMLAPHDLSIALEVMEAVPSPRAAVGQRIGDSFVFLSATLVGVGWWHTMIVSALTPLRARRIELHCEDGVAVVADGWDEHVAIFRAGTAEPEETRVETHGELPLLAELRAFVEHLRGGPPPKSSVAEGSAIVETITELRRQATSS